MANKLINESSPYLLQHAHNPVEWYPWGNEALSKAREENKLILVSIGYSACHWCHVMEHESFEDEGVAEIMNRHFVCIKIDREERPDIDQIYMTAVQLMTGSGGWPLNCICLPDQRPVYGGTYFRKDDWKNLLLNLAGLWHEKPQEAIDYAERLTGGIIQSERLVYVDQVQDFTRNDLMQIFEPWKRSFDMLEGGYNRAPKFPLPNNWQFILRYAHLMNDEAARQACGITLQKMAFGGIYDHIGGGLARYSVDGMWHVPHFEKMLYDNAQLVSLYSEAYQYQPNELFKNVVYETLAWVRREMTSPEGGFYSALDADSEGVEGKFYTFTQDELTNILGEDEEVFSLYYNVTEDGNWEEEHTNIFFRKFDDEDIMETLGISELEFYKKLNRAKKKVFEFRQHRIHPGLDDKILASWNGMMLKGFSDAYRIFDDPDFRKTAIENAEFILSALKKEGGGLYRSYKGGKATINAFLDDYALISEGLISLYEATFDEKWLIEARKLIEFAFEHFHDPESGMFFYTSSLDEKLIARKFELMDNVMPGSNSVMATCLYKLGHFFDIPDYLSVAAQMLRNIKPHIKSYGSSYSNWANLMLNEVFGVYEIAITGEKAEEKRREIEKYYIPNKILLGGTSGSLPLLLDKLGFETKVYVCKNRTCQMPVTEVSEAIKQIN
ncbi:MAG TPA: thioredoxin domain-containing protein [Sphingobacteriaceae bacterium]